MTKTKAKNKPKAQKQHRGIEPPDTLSPFSQGIWQNVTQWGAWPIERLIALLVTLEALDDLTAIRNTGGQPHEQTALRSQVLIGWRMLGLCPPCPSPK